MEPENEILVPISALEHWSYCPRQCALIHVERSFDENVYTLRGRAVHERVDTAGSELLTGVRVERAVPLFSDRLGLTGRADVVEFLVDGTPYPVEYKHGPRRKRSHDDLQLAAQALCLEEMTGRPVPEGAIFHATSKRRRNVEISASLRADVKAAIGAVRTMLGSAALPAPVNDERCQHCSLHQRCQPEAVAWRARRDVLFSELFSTPDTPETDS